MTNTGVGTLENKLQTIKDEYDSGKNKRFVGFWGNRDDTPQEASFSNFHKAFFTDEVVVNVLTGEKQEVQFSSSEQYFMYLKAYHFKDSQTMKKILQPGLEAMEYKKLGREVKGYLDSEWDKVRYEYMKQALRLKYSQNKDLYNVLMGTGDAVLVEASPFDKVWGVGLAKREKYGKLNHDWRNPYKWKGSNLLGFALMDVRDEFRK